MAVLDVSLFPHSPHPDRLCGGPILKTFPTMNLFAIAILDER
jgi:hypothetical protein